MTISVLTLQIYRLTSNTLQTIKQAVSSNLKSGGLLLKVGTDRLCLALRKTVSDYRNVIPQIFKDILHSFNYRYTLKHKLDDEDNESDDDDNKSDDEESTKQPTINQGAPIGYTRCYVEDYMVTAAGDGLLILIPDGYYAPLKTDTVAMSWTKLLKSNLPRSEHKFTDRTYSGFEAVVKENTHQENVIGGMILDSIDFMGCTISFSARLTHLLTWQEVLDGRRIGVQV